MNKKPTAADTKLLKDSLIPKSLPCSASVPKLLNKVIYGDHSVAVVKIAYSAKITTNISYEGNVACHSVAAAVPVSEIAISHFGLNF